MLYGDTVDRSALSDRHYAACNHRWALFAEVTIAVSLSVAEVGFDMVLHLLLHARHGC